MSQTPPPPPPAAPPPPPPSGPAPMGGGGSALVPTDAIGYGWRAFQKYLGPIIGVTAVIVVAQLIVRLVALSTTSVIVALLAAAIGIVLAVLFAIGLIRVALRIVDGHAPEVGQLFETTHIGAYILASILFGLMFIVGFVLCILPALIVAFLFHFYGYAIVDDDADAVSSLSASLNLVKTAVGPLIILWLLIFAINIIPSLIGGFGVVGAILSAVLSLVTYGITAIAIAYAYRTLAGKPVAPVN